MGSNLDAIVNITITPNAPAVTREGFGLPLILSDHTKYVDLVRAYTGTAGLVADGFSTTSPEYLALQAIFSQEPSPPQVLLGRRQNRVTMQADVTVTLENNTLYELTLNGVSYQYTSGSSATLGQITAGLIAAIGSQAGLTITDATPGVGSFRIAASAAGTWFQIAMGNIALLSVGQSHADPGIAADLTAIQNVENDWYALNIITEGKAELIAAAAWTESNGKLMVTDTQDSQTALHALSGATDVAASLATAEYFRTGPDYCSDNGQFRSAAWLGAVLPLDPGSETWAFKTLAGQTPDKLTPTQIANLQAKNCNYYGQVAGVNITQQGKVSGNDWIDTIRGRDALAADMQEGIFGTLIITSKIPFTDGGANTIVGKVKSSLTKFKNSGFLSDNPAPSAQAPLVANVSTQDKQARLLPGVTFTGVIAGAIQAVDIAGTVTV